MSTVILVSSELDLISGYFWSLRLETQSMRKVPSKVWWWTGQRRLWKKLPATT